MPMQQKKSRADQSMPRQQTMSTGRQNSATPRKEDAPRAQDNKGTKKRAQP